MKPDATPAARTKVVAYHRDASGRIRRPATVVDLETHRERVSRGTAQSVVSEAAQPFDMVSALAAGATTVKDSAQQATTFEFATAIATALSVWLFGTQDALLMAAFTLVCINSFLILMQKVREGQLTFDAFAEVLAQIPAFMLLIAIGNHLDLFSESKFFRTAFGSLVVGLVVASATRAALSLVGKEQRVAKLWDAVRNAFGDFFSGNGGHSTSPDTTTASPQSSAAPPSPSLRLGQRSRAMTWTLAVISILLLICLFVWFFDESRKQAPDDQSMIDMGGRYRVNICHS